MLSKMYVEKLATEARNAIIEAIFDGLDEGEKREPLNGDDTEQIANRVLVLLNEHEGNI